RRGSLRLQPGLRPVEHSEVAAHLQLPVLGPELGLVYLAVSGIHDRAALVTVAGRAQLLDDDEADDGPVLVRARAFDTGLGSSLVVEGLDQRDDLAEDLAALVVHLDVGQRLARLVVDGSPP